MFVVFRADANPEIGTGHVMRCLTLANALANATGQACHFLCRGAGLGALADQIRAAGHGLSLLPEGAPCAPSANEPPHAPWLPHGQTYDAAACQAALAALPRPDWLVVDHYALDQTWESALRTQVGQLMVIDDLADRNHVADLLLDQNLREAGDDPYRQRLPATARRLLGPGYALLRPQFFQARPDRPGSRLVIMFGGADRDDLTGQTLALLQALADSGLALPGLDVIVGPLYTGTDALRQGLATWPASRLFVGETLIAPILAEAALVIGSPGTSSWERCALGLPALTLAVADNQEALAEILARQGAHLYLGRWTLANAAAQGQKLADALRLLLSNPWLRQAMGDQAAKVCTGEGAQRVVTALIRHALPPALPCRPATLEDGPLIHAWRNDEKVRQQCFDARPLALADHLAWLARTLADPHRVLLMAQWQGQDVACLRFDLDTGPDPATARVSVFLDPARIGQGLAVPALRGGEAWLAAHHPGLGHLQAEVLADNAASHRAFAAAGYRLDHSVYLKPLAP